MKKSSQYVVTPGAKAAMVLLGFSGQLAWAVENQFFNTFLYEKITPDPRPISWMVAATAIVALLTTTLMGTLSDRTRTRWGRRRPFLLVGYIAWGIFTAAYPLAAFFKSITLGVTMAIVFDCVMSFFGSMSNDAAFNAWITDITTPDNRGKYLGIQEILKWTALLLTYAGAGLAVSAFGYFNFFFLIGGLVLVMGVIGGLLVKEPPLPEKRETKGYWRQIGATFQWKSLKQNHDLLLVWLGMMFWYIAFNIFFPYLMIYMQHFIKLEGILASLVIAIGILVGGIILAYPIGILTDAWGRKPMALVSIGAECVGLLLFSFARSPVALILTGILWVMPMAAWSIATTAWNKDLFPEESRGQFQGYEILFRVTLTMVPGPLIGGWLASRYGIPTVIDGKAGTIPTPIIFQVAGLGTLLAAVPLFFARDRQAKRA